MSKAQELSEKLVPETKYTLTKVQIKNADSRYFQPGDKVSGEAAVVGESLFIDGVITSKIVDYSENGPHFIIETKNSIYTLEKN